jgi:glutaminyl-peptide cyclotransferase
MRHCYIILMKLCLLGTVNFSAVNFASTSISYEVIAERYHNPQLFTQGLEMHDEKIYESSGLYDKSELLIYPLRFNESKWAQMTGKPEFSFKLPRKYFAEGISVFNDKIYLLTWNEKKLFVFDLKTHAELKPMSYKGEGWGLTHNNQHLIRSDGSATLYFHHPDNFKVEKKLDVKQNNQPVNQLNELEFAMGFIWANLWYQHKIIKINPDTGEVVGELDLQKIATQHYDNTEKVLNGIAWDEQRQAFWITGKWWPKMYLIKVTQTPP